ncbi:MAG: polysaccharide deacetylase family protein, partial [Bacteroidales bacterium]|nr:polysaccharide deacetylase family protein [Bacteroidales bacterium]
MERMKKTSIRQTLKIFLGTMGFWVPQKLLIRLSRQDMVLPFYHAVSDEPMPHVVNVYPVRSLKRFKKDLEFLLKHYEPVGMEDFLSAAKPGVFKRPAMLLSFDDGLSEIHDVVAPLLIEKGIPAAFFVNTGFIDNLDLFFRYKTSLILERLEKIRYSPAVTELLQSRYHLAEASKRCVRQFLLELSSRNRHELDEIAKLVELDFSTFLKIKKPYMDLQQLKVLASQGFYIGAHSRDHLLFTNLKLEDMITQYRESMEFIRKEIGTGYGIFSFPFTDDGVPARFFEEIMGEGMP